MSNKKERGQSLIEICIGMIVFIMILCGTIDLGRFYFTYVAMEDAAGEAALYYAVDNECPYDALVNGLGVADNGVADACDPPNNAIWRGINATNAQINWDEINANIYKLYSEDCKCYVAHAELTYKFRFLTPLFTAILPDPYVSITTHASEVIMRQPSGE
jgi:hypothetical protein